MENYQCSKFTTLKHGDETSCRPAVFAAHAITCWVTKRKYFTRRILWPTKQVPHQKIDQPTIGPDSIDSNWVIFINIWNCYNEMCKSTDPAVVWNKLRMAWSPEVSRLLFDLVGIETLNCATEGQLLWQVRLIAVSGQHKDVHRQNFHFMRQKEGKSITHFLACLQSVVKFFKFSVTCSNETDCSWQVNYGKWYQDLPMSNTRARYWQRLWPSQY